MSKLHIFGQVAERGARDTDCTHDSEIDFVEALLFGEEEESDNVSVVAAGSLSAYKGGEIVRFSRAWDSLFYLHAKENGNTESTYCVPILDCLFRHDRGFFGTGRLAFGFILFNRWTRCLLEYPTRSANLAQSVQTLHWANHVFMQDIAVPKESSLVVLNYLEEISEIYPLFLYPIRQWPENNETACIMRPNPRNTKLLLGIGIRGFSKDTIHDPVKFKQKNRELERVVQELEGTKWLYGGNYYSKKEFWMSIRGWSMRR